MITTLTYTVRSETTNNYMYIQHYCMYMLCWLKYGLSNLILTLTGQKLIEWSLKLYMSLLLRFFTFLTFFSKSKNGTFNVFCFVAYVFSTMINECITLLCGVTIQVTHNRLPAFLLHACGALVTTTCSYLLSSLSSMIHSRTFWGLYWLLNHSCRCSRSPNY